MQKVKKPYAKNTNKSTNNWSQKNIFKRFVADRHGLRLLCAKRTKKKTKQPDNQIHLSTPGLFCSTNVTTPIRLRMKISFLTENSLASAEKF